MDDKLLAGQLLDIYKFTDEMQQYDRIGIYGAGMVGQFIYAYLKKNGLAYRVHSFYTTEYQEKEVDGLSVRKICKENSEECNIILLAAKHNVRKELLKECVRLGILNIMEIDIFDDRDYEYFSHIPETAYPLELKNWYRQITGEELNLKKPKTFNDKINWMKLYDNDPQRTRLADKYLVREFVNEKIGKQYLIPLLGSWDNFNDIDFNKLPDKFVLKCNHGSGWNIIVNDKATFNKEDVKEKIDRWMNLNYAFIAGFEMHYKNITPKIIAEKYICDVNGDDLYDYKVHCFSGEPQFIQVIGDRDYQKHTGKQCIYDFEWDRKEWCFDDYPKYENELKKPERLDELFFLSKKLCEGFPYVRVDFYILEQLYFGEMTFSPGTGIYRYKKNYSKNDAIKLGDRIIIQESNMKKSKTYLI